MASFKDLPIHLFSSQEEFEDWLFKNHASSQGVWLQMYKKAAKRTSINYDQALDVALCYGWIDGQANSYNTDSYLQKFTPRRARSIWSKRNTEHVARLIKLGKMKPAGLAEIERAKADGRWEKAYDAQSTSKIPDDFLKALEKNKKAKAFFATLNKTNLYSIAWRLQTAKKSETRTKRMGAIIAMLEKGEKFH